MQRISLIAAISENRIIGRNNELPWKMPADLEHFYKITRGYPFIMGRKSYLSKDKLLSTKKSVILTHHITEQLEQNCVRAESLGEALSILSEEKAIFVLGGGEVFRQALSIANYMYLTIVHAYFEGDTYFPLFDLNQWEMVNELHCTKDRQNPYDYSFREYSRV